MKGTQTQKKTIRPQKEKQKGEERCKEEVENSWKSRFKMATNILTNILNVTGLNGPIRKHGVADWIMKQKSNYAA